MIIRMWALTALLLTSSLTPAHADKEGRFSAQIRRTSYGIPHITAKDHAGLGYGYGYAFAQDNVCVMASWVATLRGERSRYFGPKAMSDDPIKPTVNLASDVYHKSLLDSGLVRRLVARPEPLGPTRQLRDLVDGYVAGYNKYLNETGVANLPDPTCKGKPWVGPITAVDVWANLLDINRMAGSTRLKEAIAAAEPGVSQEKKPERKPPTAPGSNAWALGRQATREGGGMLLADPHFPWNGSRRFYQVQLTIPGVLNVSGASLYGTPVVQIGHTNSLAWTHTVSHAERLTLYQLKLTPGDPTTYLVDGKAEPMGRQQVTVTVPDESGRQGQLTRTLYTTRYGPVLAEGWSDTSAFALADANAFNLRSGNEWLAMAAARNLTELRAAQNTYQGMPFVYTLATDASGTAYFADASVVPHVTGTKAKRCAAKVQEADGYVLDGSRAACTWGSDPDAIEAGLFGPSRQPTLTRKDYVANSNMDPWLTNPEQPLTGYERIYGNVHTEREPRTRVSLDMIARRLDGSDGLGAPGFTLKTLQATAMGKRNLTAELLRPGLVRLCRTEPVMTSAEGKRVDVSKACDALAAWDGRATTASAGAILWREFYTRLGMPRIVNGEPEPPTLDWWQVSYDPAHPLTTPRGFNPRSVAARQALAGAVHTFDSQNLAYTLTPGQAQWYGAVPVPGCTEGEGCFDRVRLSGQLGAKGRYGDVNTGSSFMMAVELTAKGPRTRTVMTYSQSANPSSPHHSDQTELFSRGEWVTERFTDAEINADPSLKVTTLR